MADKTVNPRRPLLKEGRSFLPRKDREEGQAALEFMLVLPFFILFILLVVDFGLMMYEYVSISNAVREGARYGAVNCGKDGTPSGSCSEALVKTRTINRSGGILSVSAEVTVGWVDRSLVPVDNQGQGDSVIVHVNHPYRFLFVPFPGVTIPVVSCADMRLEQRDKAPVPPGLPAGTNC